MKAMKANRGVIIIACLWICALILWLALNASLLYRYRFSNSAIFPLRTIGFYAAVGGIYEVIARMPAANPELSVSAEGSASWKPDGKTHLIDYGRCSVFVRAEEETAKVNINTVSAEDLKKILEESLNAGDLISITVSQLADRILDFIDQDDYVRDRGAEKDFYEEIGLNYTPYNNPLPSIEMVLLVPGMTWELFWGSREKESSFLPARSSFFSLFTVYGSKKSLESGSEEPEGQEGKMSVWKPGGLYRIVSGADCGGNRRVVVYAIVNYMPGGNPYYSIKYIKELL